MAQSDNNKFAVTMESRWDGWCKNCKSKTQKGDLIGKEKGSGKWVHVRCPKEKKGKGVKVSELLAGNGGGHVTEEGGDVMATIEKKVFIPSVYQQAVFDWVIQASGNMILRAVAGSGKTTTIVKILDILPSTMRILFVAFNKNIVRELRSRVPENIRVVTINALGFSIIRKLEDFEKIDADKVSKIMNSFWSISKNDVQDPAVRSANRVKRNGMRRLVSLIKNTLADYNDPDILLDLINRYHIDIDELMEQEIIERVPYVMEMNDRDLATVDFDDQIYLPVTNSRLANKFDQYDFILGDECQDWNAANIQLILKSLAPGGRMVAVGDEFQSLYGFRGADTQAIPHLIDELQATTLPLSISYRCPRLHVKAAQKLVPSIQAADDAIDGVLADISYKQMVNRAEEGDMIICRTNAPLVKPAFEIIKRGMKAVIRGANIGKELVNYIDRFQCDQLGRLEALMAEHTEMEVARYLDKNKEMMAENVKERYETIMAVSSECKTVEDLVAKLETLFSDENVGVMLSSVHRAKGLEAQRVFILKPETIPHPKAKTPDEKQQENNILYVALTRSLNELYYVTSEESL